MGDYVKPMILANDELAEGIYAASGNATACDSVYMNGIFHKPDYSINNNMDGLGCNGCPAFRGNVCGVAKDGDVAFNEGHNSYDVDKGNRMPGWEREGKDPYDQRW